MTTPMELQQLADAFGSIERLKWDQVADFSGRAWDVVTELTPTERAELRAGLIDGSLPTGLVADGEPRYSRVQGAALALWTTYKPEKSSDVAAWAAVLIALLTYLDKEPAPAPTPPPPTVIVVQLPEEYRPTEELPGLPTQPAPPAE